MHTSPTERREGTVWVLLPGAEALRRRPSLFLVPEPFSLGTPESWGCSRAMPAALVFQRRDPGLCSSKSGFGTPEGMIRPMLLGTRIESNLQDG